MHLLNRIGAKVILRCPIIPGINTREEHFDQIADITSNLKNIIRIELEPYHAMGIPKFEQIGRKDYLNLTQNMAYEDANYWLAYLRNNVEIPVICS